MSMVFPGDWEERLEAEKAVRELEQWLWNDKTAAFERYYAERETRDAQVSSGE